mgnify:CR=1 FL=1
MAEVPIADGSIGVHAEVKPEPSASGVQVLVDRVLVERVQEEVTLVDGAGWGGYGVHDEKDKGSNRGPNCMLELF